MQDKNEHIEDLENKKKQSRKYSILDGSFWSIMYGFGESFFSTFAVFLKATNLELGFLASFPQMIGSFFQLLSRQLITVFGSRKKAVILLSMIQAFMHIPIALVFFLGEFKVFYLILFVCIYFILGMVAGPIWTSWISDLVDDDKRGSYFGIRNKICGTVSFLSYLLGGFILQKFQQSYYVYFGFLILFSISFFSRLISVFFLTKKFEPHIELEPQERFGLIKFIKDVKKSNFGNFVLFLCFFNFSVGIAGPFFVPYMLNDLKLNYIMFTIINATAMVTKIVVMPIWGKACDKFGEKKIISATGLLMPFIPMLWLFSTDPYYLIGIHVFTGFVWAGLEISTFNYILSSTEAKKRVSYVAYYNVLNGVFVFVGAMIGGLIVKYNNVFWSKYLLVILISGVLRAVSFLIFVPRLKEVRNVEPITKQKLLAEMIMSMPKAAFRDMFFPFLTANKIRKRIILPRHFIKNVEELIFHPRHKIRAIEEMFGFKEKKNKKK